MEKKDFWRANYQNFHPPFNFVNTKQKTMYMILKGVFLNDFQNKIAETIPKKKLLIRMGYPTEGKDWTKAKISLKEPISF